MNKVMNKTEIIEMWEGFHWLFFVYIQGLIICLRRFETYIEASNFQQAQVELETAAELMFASGGAMELAGNFSRQEYEHLIRPDMMPPNVKSDNFSGLMSWDHALLIQIWKSLSPVFETLPDPLAPHYDKFVAAYLSLSSSHTAICDKFGGDEAGSLRCNKTSAVSKLEKFANNRLKLLDPSHRLTGSCPFSCSVHPN